MTAGHQTRRGTRRGVSIQVWHAWYHVYAYMTYKSKGKSAVLRHFASYIHITQHFASYKCEPSKLWVYSSNAGR